MSYTHDYIEAGPAARALHPHFSNPTRVVVTTTMLDPERQLSEHPRNR